jgi:Cu/Ag efflux pump CusA
LTLHVKVPPEAPGRGEFHPSHETIQYGGQFESAESASRIISLLSLLSLVLIIVALNLEFGNLRDTLLVLVNLPLALIGGCWLVITGGVLNIASMVGFITLSPYCSIDSEKGIRVPARETGWKKRVALF